MVKCSVAGCNNRQEIKDEKIRYYTFPRDDKLCQQWVSACGKRKPFTIETARICSEHFTQSDFKLQDILLKVPNNKRRLQKDAVPSTNLPYEKQPSKQEKKRQLLANKALVEESLASYEKKQKELHDYENDGSLTYVCSTILENAIQSCPDSTKKKSLGHGYHNADFPESNTKLEKGLDEHSYSHINYFTNGSTQTEVDFECCKELHIMKLETQNRRLKATLKKQIQRSQENEVMRSSLRRMMTIGQINRLIHPGKKSKWKAEDIASAMSLYTASPVAYELLRTKMFPLPSSSTLRGWAGKIKMKPGFIDNVFQLMSKLNYSENERLCVLCFGKMRLKASTYKSENSSTTRAKYAHIVMARGLTNDWTQIVYYDLDTPMTVSVLKSVITKLEGIKFVVSAVSSDMGPTTPALMDALGISENQPFFLHPCDQTKKIFYFVDSLHLIKLLRNRFIDNGFVLYGKTIDTAPIKEILGIDKSELDISHEHVEVNKLARLKVNLATQLLSNSVSAAINRCVSNGKIQSFSALECAEFIKAVSEWFDLFNSKSANDSTDSNEHTKAFGLSLVVQNSILISMTEKMQNLKPVKKQPSLYFQSGFLLNSTGLPLMLNYLRMKYNLTYIQTDKLNHGELEHFFNIIRSKNGPQHHPTPLEFKYRLRSSILGKIVL